MAILGYKNNGTASAVRAFGLAAWLESRGLAGWLDIATEGLEAPAKLRIAREIEAHYAEAVSAHMAAGEPELSAQVSALAELGDPRLAAVNFQKRYLTESEAKRVRKMEQRATKPLFSIRMLPLDIMPLVVLVFLCLPVRQHFPWRLMGLGILVEYAGSRLIPRLLCASAFSRKSFLKGLALSTLLTQVALSAWCALFMFKTSHSFFASGCLCSYFFLLTNYTSNSPWRMWNKLRKTVAIHEDGMPPDRITSA